MPNAKRWIVVTVAGIAAVAICILLVATLDNSKAAPTKAQATLTGPELPACPRTSSQDWTMPEQIAATSISTPTVSGCTRLHMLFPLYKYPLWWDPPNYIWDDVAEANSHIPITAIINPSDGPGDGCPNSDYERGLADLRAAGVTILGYIDTNYGVRSIDDVKADADLYNQLCYDVDGIFLDRASTSEGMCSYYGELCRYVKEELSYVNLAFLNPGTCPDECYFRDTCCDTMVILEDESTEWPIDCAFCSYLASYSSDRSAVVAHTITDTQAVDTMKWHIELAVTCGMGYAYATDDTDSEDNPYDSLPSFWEEEVGWFESLNTCSTWLPLVVRNR